MTKSNDNRIVPAMKILYLSDEPTIFIGSSYKTDIYYQYKNQISPQQAVLYYQNHEIYYKDLDKDDIGHKLIYGECVNIAELSIYYLNSVLLINAREGDLRIACRKRRT